MPLLRFKLIVDHVRNCAYAAGTISIANFSPHAGADAVTYAGGACAVLPMHLNKHLQTIRACLSDARLGCMCVCVCVCVHVHMVMLGWCVCMPSVYTFADYDSMLE